MKKIYVASKFENKTAVRDLHALLRSRGHEITHDWTGEDAKGLSGDALVGYLERCARADYDAVAGADALVLLPHGHMRGAWVEVGFAVAHRVPVFVVGRRREDAECIFEHLSGVFHVGDADELLLVLDMPEWLLRPARAS